MRKVFRKILIVFGQEKMLEKLYEQKNRFSYWFNVFVFVPIVLNVSVIRRIAIAFSSAFNYEYKKYLQSKKIYFQGIRSKEGNEFLLRRNIHRIEKGLIMRPRKDVFALSYLEETIDLYDKIGRGKGNLDSKLIAWGNSILDKYFSLVGEHETVKHCFSKYESVKKGTSSTNQFEPFLPSTDRDEKDCANFFDLAHKRKSVRWFKQDLLPERAIIDKAIEIASLSPSSCNRQPYRFIVVDDKKLVRDIADLPGGAIGFNHNIPIMMIVVGQMNASPTIGDRHIMYVDGSLAAMTLMFALESLNISSCPLNWPEDKQKDEKISKVLNLSVSERPIMMIGIGYSDETGYLACSARKTLDEIRTYNRG